MRCIAPPNIPEPETHIELLNERRKGPVEPELVRMLKSRFECYYAAGSELRRLPSRTEQLRPYLDMLHGLYVSTTTTAEHIRQSIWKNAPVRCPYCGSPRRPNSLDHFLPRSGFQEFSIFAINLIPVCMECNTAKGVDVWDNDSQRLFLNPYIDRFLDTCFVSVIIKPDTKESYETPLFEFAFTAGGCYDRICQQHFIRLNVDGILRDYFGQQLRVLRRRVKERVLRRTLTASDLSHELMQDEKASTDEYGMNCWESLFTRSVLSNDNVLHFICNHPIQPFAAVI